MPPCLARGFTLIELLVVIGIIMLLIGILVPVVAKVQLNATIAEQRAQINRLSTAIEQYNLAYHNYPGPVSNADLYTGTNLPVASMTDSENLLLGLLGGLRYDASASTPGVVYDANILASQQGPFNLNPSASRGGTQSFVNLKPDELSTSDSSANLGSAIPEVMDRFVGSKNQVMYFRASKGRSGVVDDTNVDWPQYNLYRNKIYTNKNSTNTTNGLRVVGSAGTMATATKPAAGRGYDALPYFVDQINPGPTGWTKSTGNARVKDSFMLISAGPDEIYGTADDICSFGAVIP